MGTTTNYASALQQRITQLTGRHTVMLAEHQWWAQRMHDMDIAAEAGEYRYAEMQTMSFSSTAAYIWNLKCEVEKCLSLYEVEHPTFANNVDRDCAYVATCIKSCVNEAQLDTCRKMIEGLSIIHPQSTQLTSWQDSLRFEILRAQGRLLL